MKVAVYLIYPKCRLDWIAECDSLRECDSNASLLPPLLPLLKFKIHTPAPQFSSKHLYSSGGVSCLCMCSLLGDCSRDRPDLSKRDLKRFKKRKLSKYFDEFERSKSTESEEEEYDDYEKIHLFWWFFNFAAIRLSFSFHRWTLRLYLTPFLPLTRLNAISTCTNHHRHRDLPAANNLNVCSIWTSIVVNRERKRRQPRVYSQSCGNIATQHLTYFYFHCVYISNYLSHHYWMQHFWGSIVLLPTFLPI